MSRPHARKRQRSRRQPDGALLAKALLSCPFRSLLGTGTDPDEMAARISCAIAVLGGTPEPMSQRMLADAIAVLRAGKVVLLVSDNRALRDFAKCEILAMAGAAGGSA